ncbi:hypothetical protein SDC9_105784 [bioreactor metagenome]|uniref:Uncharacterized protein n=1 Tax=bioreactor metagenome TaxID=1076179 RepID=A0A645B0L6_9ZZZZ
MHFGLLQPGDTAKQVFDPRRHAGHHMGFQLCKVNEEVTVQHRVDQRKLVHPCALYRAGAAGGFAPNGNAHALANLQQTAGAVYCAHTALGIQPSAGICQRDLRHPAPVQRVDHRRHRLAAFAQHRQRAAEQHGKQQHLQHIARGKGLHHGVGDQLHQKVHQAARGELVGVAGVRAHGRGVQRLHIHVHAVAGLEHKGQHQAHDQRDGGEHLKIHQRLHAHAAHAAQVARPGDAMHHHTEHQHRNDHLDQLDEAVAQRFELDGEFGRCKPQKNPDGQRYQHLPEE